MADGSPSVPSCIRLAIVISIAMIVACSRSSAPPRSLSSEPPRTLSYDAKSKTVYWCGHLLVSPVLVSMTPHALLLNGVSDASGGVFASHATLLATTPAGHRLLAAGYPRQAVEEYLEHRKDSLLYVALTTYRFAIKQHRLNPSAIARGVLDTTLFALSPGPEFDDASIGVHLRGLRVEYRYRPASDDTLPLPKYLQLVSAVRARQAQGRPQRMLESIEGLLDVPAPALIVSNGASVFSILGSRAPIAAAYIDSMIARHDASNLWVPTDYAIPQHLLRQIIDASATGRPARRANARSRS